MLIDSPLQYKGPTDTVSTLLTHCTLRTETELCRYTMYTTDTCIRIFEIFLSVFDHVSSYAHRSLQTLKEVDRGRPSPDTVVVEVWARSVLPACTQQQQYVIKAKPSAPQATFFHMPSNTTLYCTHHLRTCKIQHGKPRNLASRLLGHPTFLRR